jgi:hypothetical protein
MIVTAAIEISAAIRPYSIAVAPSSFLKSLATACYHLPELDPAPVDVETVVICCCFLPEDVSNQPVPRQRNEKQQRRADDQHLEMG